MEEEDEQVGGLAKNEIKCREGLRTLLLFHVIIPCLHT